jgi:cytochrome c553
MLLLPLAQGPGDAAAGKALWQANNACRNCHGDNGEGMFGPDLAGHQLTPAQFLRAVRQPWGIMPRFTPEKNFTDQEIANLAAHLASLPKVTTPGTWRTPIPPNASPKQEILIANGCGQCHGAIMGNPRRDAGGEGADFEWFKSMVYTHTTAMEQPKLRMGNYSRTRMPEVALRQIWEYMTVEAGLRVPVTGQISSGVRGDRGVTFTLTVTNDGVPGKGLTAENLTIGLSLAAETTVAATTGTGYQGTRRDAKGEVAVWQLSRLAPGDKQTYSVTVAGNAAATGITGGNIGWAKPALGDGTTDQQPIAAPRPAQAQAAR